MKIYDIENHSPNKLFSLKDLSQSIDQPLNKIYE